MIESCDSNMTQLEMKQRKLDLKMTLTWQAIIRIWREKEISYEY